jgi:hypothetical protein
MEDHTVAYGDDDMIYNVHERRIAAPVHEVGALLGSLGSPDDRLWPDDRWPPLELDAPLGPGAAGGHADIRYTVTEYRPGGRVVFAFDPPTGLVGTHRFEVEAHPDGGSVLRHVLEAQPRGSMRLLAPLAVRWLHDALIEDALDRAERSLGVGPARPARWSPYVRALRALVLPHAPVREVPVPQHAAALSGLPAADFADAFAGTLPAGASRDVRDWHARLITAGVPSWVGALVGIRSVLARALRLDTAGALRGQSGPFAVVSADHDLVVTGQDDKHLDFRVLLQVRGTPSGSDELVLTTVVQRHNRIGLAYFALVRPFHTRVVRAILRRVLRDGHDRGRAEPAVSRTGHP